MPKITYIAADGREYLVDAPCGLSAMEAAVQNFVPGIDGDCGGAAACGTCHVHVDAAWTAVVGPATPGIEQDMLGLSDVQAANSRLACQIRLKQAHEGLVLRMPMNQH